MLPWRSLAFPLSAIEISHTCRTIDPRAEASYAIIISNYELRWKIKFFQEHTNIQNTHITGLKKSLLNIQMSQGIRTLFIAQHRDLDKYGNGLRWMPATRKKS